MEDGYKVSVVQHPETSCRRRTRSTPKAAIDAMGGPVVLVGHSYGGSVITEAGNHPALRRLSISRICWTPGKAAPASRRLAAKPQRRSAGQQRQLVVEQEHFAADFAAKIPKDQAQFMAISQVPISTDAFTHKVTKPAWKTKPTWYMVATEDRSINPEQERMTGEARPTPRRSRSEVRPCGLHVPSGRIGQADRGSSHLRVGQTLKRRATVLQKSLLGGVKKASRVSGTRQESDVKNQIVDQVCRWDIPRLHRTGRPSYPHRR